MVRYDIGADSRKFRRRNPVLRAGAVDSQGEMRFIDGEGLRVLRMKPQAGDPLDASRAYSKRQHFPVMRGVFGFNWAGSQGTLTVTEGRTPGFVHATVYCTRGSSQSVPLRTEAEVREGWIRQVTVGLSNREDEVLRVVERLFEVATIAGQRTVKIKTAA